MKAIKIWRVIFGIFFIGCLSVSCSKADGTPPPKGPGEETDTLEEVSVSNITVYYPNYHTISYSVQPVSLQKQVTIRYTLSNSAHAAFIELFDSDHAVHPNSVRAKSNTAGNYNVTATVSDAAGTSKQASFIVTVSTTPPPVTYPTSIAAGDLSVYAGEGSAAISYTIAPSSLQSTAAVSYSPAAGLVFAGNNVSAAAGATAGPRTITATAVNPEDASVQVTCTFSVTVLHRQPDPPEPPETTKSTTERDGQTVAQLASTFDATASTCTVQPIDNITTFSQAYLDDYIRGVDMGSIIEVEAAGGKFYDNDRYRVGDVFELLSYYGINWVRIRLWNDPYTATGQPYGGGTNDYDKAVAIAKRAKKWGMKVLLDFHYSDFWAHPGQQSVPKAWSHLVSDVDALAATLKTYTKQTLSDMYAEGAMPDMVQVGNEINTGVCGFLESGNTRANEKKLLAAGLAAVREISAEYGYPIKTMLHATDGITTVDWYFGVMQSLDFDILGMSFYPMWHGDYTSFKNGLQSLANKYKKQICVLEYSVSYTSQAGSPNGSNMYGNSNADVRTYLNSGETDRTIQGQASVIRNLNNAIMNNTVSDGVRYGIGAFWWEPAWLPLNGTAWAFTASNEWYRMELPGSDSGATNNPGSNPRVTWANQAFFSFTGTALPSLNAFLQMMGKPARPSS